MASDRAVWVNLLPEQEGDNSSRKGVFGIEVAATGGHGEFDIDLLSGETISAGGTISGPATVRTEFTMIEASVAVRGGTRGERFNFHGIAGFGYHEMRLKLTSGATRLDRSVNSIGPLLGVHIGFLATEWLEIYGRGSILLLDLDNVDDFGLSLSSQVEVGVQLNLHDAISLIAAYRWWRLEQESVFSLGTDIDIRGGGVVVGLVFRF